MEWHQLEYFYTAAQLQHFTEAARKLSISQPALSRSIAKLEQELGVPLFDRQGRMLTLNGNGRVFYSRVSRIIQEMKEAKRDLEELQNPEYGQLSLAFLKSLGIRYVPRLVRAFQQQYPHVSFQLFQNSSREMHTYLRQGEVDFCLTYLTEDCNEFECRELWTEEFFLFVPGSHRLAPFSQVHLRDMIAERFIVLKPGYGSRDIFDRLFASVGVQPHIAFEGEEVVSALGFVAANLGVALLPSIQEMDMKDIVRIPIADYRCERTIAVTWKKGKYMGAAARRFLSFLTELAGERSPR